MEFAEFVRRYQDMVYSTALRITADPDESQDIAQEVFVRAHAWYGRLESPERAGAWLRETARNVSLNHITRYRKRFESGHFSPDDEDSDLSAVEGGDDGWLYDHLDLLKRGLLKLDAAFRIPLVLHYYEDMAIGEIARRLRVSLTKIKTDLMRGRRTLRTIIDRMENTDENAPTTSRA